MLSHCKLIKEEFKQPLSLALFMNGDVHHIDIDIVQKRLQGGYVTGVQLPVRGFKVQVLNDVQ